MAEYNSKCYVNSANLDKFWYGSGIMHIEYMAQNHCLQSASLIPEYAHFPTTACIPLSPSYTFKAEANLLLQNHHSYINISLSEIIFSCISPKFTTEKMFSMTIILHIFSVMLQLFAQ
jgi:hypothetical protein